MDWLVELMDSTVEYESPRQFWYWSGLSIISATVKDQVWVERGGLEELNIYLNIYVMLYAKSGMRKSAPISFARRLVKSNEITRVFSGRASIEAIVQSLGKAFTTSQKKIIVDACAFVTASEFSSSLINNPQALTIFTDLYDRNYNSGDWQNLMKNVGVDNLKNPTLSMLIGTNPAHLKDFVQAKDMFGGFFGRTFIIHAEKKHRSSSLFGRKVVKRPDIEKLSAYLRELNKLRGPFTNTEPAAEIYDTWYNQHDLASQENDAEDKTGTSERTGDSVLKVAALLSLSESTDMVINERHILKAIELCEPLIHTVNRASRGKGKSTFGEATALILDELWKNEGKISREKLLTKYWGEFDALDLNRIVVTLEDQKAITTEREGSTVIYKMPPAVWEAYNKFRKESKH
jgi:hypothetical protein